MHRISIAALPLALLSACGAGPYGYARAYEPLGDEDDYFDAAIPVGYEELRRDPEDFRNKMFGWFGVVTAVEGSGETVRVSMTFRRHRDRHLCSDETASSCRVTVSERAGGPFSATLTLTPEDRGGQDRLWIGSLVKVYGTHTGEFDEAGGPVLSVRYYRHWPRGHYVTTASSNAMRR